MLIRESAGGRARARGLLWLAALLVLAGAICPQAAYGSGITGAETAGVYTTISWAAASAYAPSDPPAPAPPIVGTGRFRYFPETGHFLRGIFYDYWRTHGATPVLGLPITEALSEDGLVVQYLERARLEWHPEISTDPRQQVLLTRLGAIITERRGLRFEPLPSGTSTASSVFFPQTGHNLANAFLAYWQRNGGLAVFGYPLSEEMVEVNPADGRPYTVQYFERNRFEWHPELGPASNVQLGLLGVEYARMVGLNPLARVLLPAYFPGADVDQSSSPGLAELIEQDLLPSIQALGETPQFRWVPALILRYGVRVEFADITEEDVAGAFVATRSRTRPYLIVIPERYRGESLETLASVLAHEATHAYDVITGALTSPDCSLEGELRAYMNGLAAWLVLRGEDALVPDPDMDSFEVALVRSLRLFNGNKTHLDFDFDPQQGRRYLRVLYGSECEGVRLGEGFYSLYGTVVR